MNNKNKPLWLIKKNIILFPLVILMIFLVFFIYGMQRRHAYWENIRIKWEKTHQQITASEIQPWMTFDYLNKTFHLPPEYLKEKFNITDKKYPKIPIHSYAKKAGLDSRSFLEDVKKSISQYLNL